jgi:hypothetical protein
MGQSPETFSFVTVTGSGSNKQYYCYGADGSKTGPVKSPDPKYWAGNEGKKADDCVANDDADDTDMSKYFDYSTGTIKFQGKSFGPAGQPMQMALSKDGQQLYAIVLTTEMKFVFCDNAGRKVDITGMPEQLIVSPDGKIAFAKVNGTLNPFDPEAMAKMMENPESMNNPPITLVGIDGTKSGPFAQADYRDAWFTESGLLVTYVGQEIMVNGKMLFKTSEYVAPCDLWINSNGTDYAWANYQNIHFKDGSKQVAPIDIHYTFSGGKGYLKWIALENGNSLVLYKKSF